MSHLINNPESFPRSPSPERMPSWLAYAASVTLTAATVFFRLALGFKPGDLPTPFLFLIPIIISAYLGGWGPGLLSTSLSAFFVNYFLMEPIYTLSIGSRINQVMWVTFMITGTLISLLAEALHRSRYRAERALMELRRAEDELRRRQQFRAEEALRQSEQKLETALRASRMVSFVWDPVANVMQTNGDFAEIYGRPPITKSEEGFALVHPEDRRRHRATIEKAAREGGSYVMEFRIIRPDNGAVVWIEDRADIVLDQAGRIKAIAGISVDVTKRKQMEEALRESEQKFSIIYDKAAFAIMLARLPGEEIVDVNDAWVKMYGYSKQEAAGKTGLELGLDRNPEERARLFEALQEKGAVRNMETSVYTKSGARLVISCNIDVVELGGEKYLLSTMHDITVQKQAEEVLARSRAELEALVAERTSELSATNDALSAEIGVRRRTEEALNQSENRLRQILDGLFGFVGLYNLDGTVIEVNKAPLLAGGVEKEEVLGRPFWDTYWWNYDTRVQSELKDAMARAARGENVRYEPAVRVQGGRLITVDTTFGPLRNKSGEVAFILAFGVDITERKRAEEALKETEARLRLALHAGRIGTWDWNMVTRKIIWSRGTEELFGMDPGAFQGTYAEVESRLHPEDREGWNRAVAEAIAERRVYRKEFRIIRPDGQVHWIAGQGEPFFNEAGEPVRMVGVVRDITESKRAEERLREYEKAVEGLEEMIVVVDRNYRYVIANRAFLAYRDMTRDELIGNFVGDVLNREVFEKTVKGKLDACFQGNVVKYELKYTYPLLGERDLFIQYFPIEGPDGIDRASCILQDITERKEGERALRKSEERFQLAARATNDVIWEWDFIANTVWWNENFKTLFGYEGEEIAPGIESWTNRLHPEDKERIVSGVHAVIDLDQRFWSGEYRFLRGDGSYATVLDRGYVVQDEHGRAIRMIGAMTDITERTRAEEEIKKLNVDLERRVRERTAELETANKELESFSYSVSHDLRAPLRGIAGFSRVLLARYLDRLDDQGKDFLQRVDAASRRMGELIEDLLNLSRITRTEMRREEVDLTLLARSIAAELQQTEPEREVTFLIQDHLTTSGDPRLLRIVLENLLGNAWKFTSKHPTATIEFGRIEKNGKPVYFVRDNGAGFDMAYVDKLFGPFQRLHSLNEFAGTGIGLATVQRIIHRHGGEVWAEGNVEKGATLYFTL